MSSPASILSDISFNVRLGNTSTALHLSSAQCVAGDSQAFEALLTVIEGAFALPKNSFRLSYFDEEHEKISVTCWNDFKVAVDEHSSMKKAVQLYIEQADDADAEEEDLVFINNSPHVASSAKQSDAQSQTLAVTHQDAFTQSSAQLHQAQSIVQPTVQVNAATAANTSFWWRLFGNGNAGVVNMNDVASASSVQSKSADCEVADYSVSPAPVAADANNAIAIAASPVPLATSPTLSMLLLSDLSELLNHLRGEAVKQLESNEVDQLSAALYNKVQFQRTKQMFEEELHEALAEMRKRSNPSCASEASKKNEVEDDALAAIEQEEKKDSARSVKQASAISYAAVVAASVSSTSSASAGSASSSSVSISVPAACAAAATAPSIVESKSASYSSPASFVMSAQSIAEVLEMSNRMGFKADPEKIKYLMEKSKGDMDTLIDWLITDSVVKITVPK